MQFNKLEWVIHVLEAIFSWNTDSINIPKIAKISGKIASQSDFFETYILKQNVYSYCDQRI